MMVYLTGGIGSGKSTALSMFADLGARIVSADVIVHGLLTQPEVRAVIESTLGVEDAGNRAEIAQRVFADRDALRMLESVIHPLVAEAIEEVRTSLPASEILVYEVPLPPTPKPGEIVVAIEASLATRRARLLERGLSAEDADARIAVQGDPSDYRRHATHVLVNDGSEDELQAQVARVWEVLQRDARNL